MKTLRTQADLLRIQENSLPEDFKHSNSRKKSVKKRKRKSNEQLSLLVKVFQTSLDWDKETLALLSSQTGLTEAQIYKWSWDQRKKIQAQDKVKIKSHNLSEIFDSLPSCRVSLSNKPGDLCIDTKDLECNEMISPRSIDYDIYVVQRKYRGRVESLSKAGLEDML